MQLYIANKNYSSWSMRPWILMKHAGIAFSEVTLDFNDPQFHAKLQQVSPAGRVPVLVDGALTVWDSLAIIEYLAEVCPDKAIWPRERNARARARSLCAEMHAGFGELRNHMAHIIDATLPGRGWSIAVQKDIDRIEAAFNEALATSSGPFLFGEFGAVDAYYTPVAVRFRTYGITLRGAAADYVARLLSTPTFKELEILARAERNFVQKDEQYRTNPY